MWHGKGHTRMGRRAWEHILGPLISVRDASPDSIWVAFMPLQGAQISSDQLHGPSTLDVSCRDFPSRQTSSGTKKNHVQHPAKRVDAVRMGPVLYQRRIARILLQPQIALPYERQRLCIIACRCDFLRDLLYAANPHAHPKASRPWVWGVQVIRFLESWVTGSGGLVQYTPGGLAWASEWGTLRYTMNAAFIAVVFANSIQSAL